jgi:hypothetical protein
LGKFDVVRGDPVRLPGGLPDDVLDALLMLGTDIPAPWFGTEQDIQDIVTAPAAEKAAAFKRASARTSEEKQKITTIFLDFVTSNGLRFDEEFLGHFPDVHFEPPQLHPDSPMNQDKFNQRWAKREEPIEIGAFYQEDYPKLAATLREWAKEPHKPFPLQFESGPMDLPDARTAVEINFEPARDRLWYIEHPTRITLRPASLEEQYQIEREYWASKGDAARVELVEERLERLRKKPTSTELAEPDSSGCPAPTTGLRK